MPRIATKSRAPASKKSQPQASEPTSPQNAAPTSEFEIGGKVAHAKFGNGVVKTIDGEKLTIQFSANVIKQIVDYYVKHRR